jgi:hypothetical protein
LSTYQTYDFIKDINFHIKNKNPIHLNTKSEIFKNFLFRLKLFQLHDRIKKNHPIFDEVYFLFILYSTLYVAKRFGDNSLKFDYVEIVNGIRVIRKMKLKKLFKFFN